MKWFLRVFIGFGVATVAATIINVWALKQRGDIYTIASSAGNAVFAPVGLMVFGNYKSEIVRRERLQAVVKQGYGDQFSNPKGFDRDSEYSKATAEARCYSLILMASFWIPIVLLKPKNSRNEGG